MSIETGQNIIASDFIDESERNATPSNDSGRVAKLESDGRQHPFFTRNGQVLTAGETLNGATTPVPVYQDDSDNELYACDANDTSKMKFIGFAIDDGTDGNDVSFQGSGIVTGFSSLSEGEKYYVQDTAGTIDTSPGTNEVLVGVAISTTDLLIQKGIRRAAGSFAQADVGEANDTVTNSITVGFRPSVIRVTAYLDSQSGGDVSGLSAGVWINGNHFSARTNPDDQGDTGGVSSSQIINIGSGGNSHWQVTITSVTDTGWTFSMTQKIDSVEDIWIVWEAEGEL